MAQRIGYLVSQYPTISHTYILREIIGLRELGLEVEVASVLLPDRTPEQLSETEGAEFRRTFYVRAAILRWPLDHLRTLLTRPAGYFAGLAAAISTSRGDLPQLARHLLFFAEAVSVGRWMQRSGLHAFHTHFATATAMFAARIFPVRMSMTLHGAGEFVEPVTFCISEKVAAATLVIAISNFGASQIMRFSDLKDWNKIAIARLGVDPNEIQSSPTTSPTGTYAAICVASLVAAKAHGVLLRAIAILLAEGRRIQLVLVGGGPERSRLETLASELGIQSAVKFTGALPNEQARQLVAAANVFVLASFAEGVPVVLMEAMALGIPCVATWVAGVPELITDGEDGLLCAPADPVAFAECIRKVMDDDALAARLVEAARNKVSLLYDHRRNIARLAEELRKLI